MKVDERKTDAVVDLVNAAISLLLNASPLKPGYSIIPDAKINAVANAIAELRDVLHLHQNGVSANNENNI